MNSILDLAQDLYLDKTTYLQHIPQTEFRQYLVSFYNHKKEGVKGISSILNAIYTCGKPTFHISRRSFKRLLKGDEKNQKAKGRIGVVNVDKAYFDVISLLKNSNEFEIVDGYRENSFVPVLVSLIDEKLISSMGNQVTMESASSWRQSAMKMHEHLKMTYENQMPMPV